MIVLVSLGSTVVLIAIIAVCRRQQQRRVNIDGEGIKAPVEMIQTKHANNNQGGVPQQVEVDVQPGLVVVGAEGEPGESAQEGEPFGQPEHGGAYVDIPPRVVLAPTAQ